MSSSASGPRFEQVAQGLFAGFLLPFQVHEVVARGQQGLFGRNGFQTVHLARPILVVHDAVQFLVEFDAAPGDFLGLAHILKVVVSVDDVVDQSQASAFAILFCGLVFPFLGRGRVAQLAPQVQLVADAQVASVGFRRNRRFWR